MVVKATVKGRYEDGNRGSAAASLAFAGPDGVKLRASLTDASIVNGPSFEGVALALDKPGAFVVSYDVPKKDVRFQFMNTVRVADKPLHLTYAHARKDNRTTLDGTFVFDPANKVSANYAFGSGNCKVKYTYLHGGGLRTFEPCYDFSKNSWDFSISHKVYEDDVVKASYQTSSSVLNLDWMRNSKGSSSFKISTSMNLAEEIKAPKITAETTWNFDI